MKYMLLIYGAEDAWSEDERESCYAESIRLTHDLKEQGQYLGASPLQPGRDGDERAGPRRASGW